MTAASSRTPRTPTYREGRPASRERAWERNDYGTPGYDPRHRLDEHTPSDRTVPAIVERVR